MVKPQICVYGRADTISHHFGGGMGVGYVPSSSLPITVLGRSLNDPVVIEVGVISDPHQLQHLAEQVLLLTMSVQMWVSQPQSYKYRRALLFLICLVAAWAGERYPSTPSLAHQYLGQVVDLIL